MLSNKDFKALLTSQSSSGGQSNGKTRFDLKQVKQMDKDNERRMAKSQFKKERSDTGTGISYLKNKDKNSGYRDRAEERRKLENNEDKGIHEQLDVIAAKLDREQTKYLGGDVEHTHLVKGLDYSLLRQVKHSLESNPQPEIDSKLLSNKDDISLINTASTIGTKMKSYLISIKSDKLSRHVDGKKNDPSCFVELKTKRSYFEQLVFEFDVDPLSFTDLPILLSGSKQSQAESKMNYAMLDSLFEKLKGILSKIRETKLKKKKNNDSSGVLEYAVSTKGNDNPLSSSSNRIGNIKADDNDIYGGIISEAVGKYVPIGSLELDDKTTGLENPLKPYEVPSSIQVAKNNKILADDLIKDVLSDQKNELVDFRDNTSKIKSSNSDSETKYTLPSDILIPVKDLLAAQSKKEADDDRKLQLAAEMGLKYAKTKLNAHQPTSNITVDINSNRDITKPLIHRSIFDNIEVKSELKKNKGDLMGYGTYDMFSDVNNFERVDSDDDNEPVVRKRAKRK